MIVVISPLHSVTRAFSYTDPRPETRVPISATNKKSALRTLVFKSTNLPWFNPTKCALIQILRSENLQMITSFLSFSAGVGRYGFVETATISLDIRLKLTQPGN